MTQTVNQLLDEFDGLQKHLRAAVMGTETYRQDRARWIAVVAQIVGIPETEIFDMVGLCQLCRTQGETSPFMFAPNEHGWDLGDLPTGRRVYPFGLCKTCGLEKPHDLVIAKVAYTFAVIILSTNYDIENMEHVPDHQHPASPLP